MLNSSIRVVLVAVLVLSWGISGLTQAQPPRRIAIPPGLRVQGHLKAATPTRSQAKGVQRLQLLNKSVIMEGYFYDGSVPMLIDNFQKTLCDMELPAESYILLSGPQLKGVKSGNKIRVQGILKTAQRPRSGRRRVTESGSLH